MAYKPQLGRSVDNKWILHNVKCKVFSVIEGQPKFLLPKWDTFTKHKGRYKAKKNMS
jgi:hypothetical protein